MRNRARSTIPSPRTSSLPAMAGGGVASMLAGRYGSARPDRPTRIWTRRQVQRRRGSDAAKRKIGFAGARGAADQHRLSIEGQRRAVDEFSRARGQGHSIDPMSPAGGRWLRLTATMQRGPAGERQSAHPSDARRCRLAAVLFSAVISPPCARTISREIEGRDPSSCREWLRCPGGRCRSGRTRWSGDRAGMPGP